MRFIENGPSVPNELVLACDEGDVIFFCGAGVSANAKLPNFEKLARDVIRALGAAKGSPARKLLNKALEMGQIAGVGGLLATDRIFGLLEREFETADVRSAVAAALRPEEGCSLDAHQTLLELATSRGVTRLVTTNFDLLFEACDRTLFSWGPPHLPDPRSPKGFRGIVHLHGRVDQAYARAEDDEFVVASADYGRAYLADGWATRFIQALLARFQIVFVGYSADDPPVQYLLEALNLRAGNRNRLYAFQQGDRGEATSLWESRGVEAIPFDASDGFHRLWDTLAAWAERGRDIDGWHSRLIAQAAVGPHAVNAHIRGKIADLWSTREGAQSIATATNTLGSEWLLVLDPIQRYASPERETPYDDTSKMFDPFDHLHLDVDAPPKSRDPDDLFNRRETPEDAWDAFAINRLDEEGKTDNTNGWVRGQGAYREAPLVARHGNIGLWLQKIAHQPITLWWAAGQTGLHPEIQRGIEFAIRQDLTRLPETIRRGWRLLFASWNDRRPSADHKIYEIREKAQRDGWTGSLVRELASLYRPQLKATAAHGIPHPLLWDQLKDGPEHLLQVIIDYRGPHEHQPVPDEYVPLQVSLFRQNLELAISLEKEIKGDDLLYFETSRANDEGPELDEDSYGLTGPIVRFQNLMSRLAQLDAVAAMREIVSWPATDLYVFARLRIWAAGKPFVDPAHSADIVASPPETVFWGHRHQRDLLYAIRDRWNDLPLEARVSLEDRLRNGAYPYESDVEGGVERAVARDRLDRLHWLSNQGVRFGFDQPAEIERLKRAAPEWTTRSGDSAADSWAPVVGSISTNDDAAGLIDLPIQNILEEANSISGLDFLERVQREPFQGLASRRPARALAALTHAGRRGEAPKQFWSVFLRANDRTDIPARMIRATAMRLARLRLEQLLEIAYPVSDWMLKMSGRLYGDVADVFPLLWERLVNALALSPSESRHRPNRSWADDALNAPVGKLVDLLLKDPTVIGLAPAAGFLIHWTNRLDALFALPGDLRRHALVMVSFHSLWLFNIDPRWTTRQVVQCADDPGEDGNAFWGGLTWRGASPQEQLFQLIKDALISRALQPRLRGEFTNIIAGLLLSGWIGHLDGGRPSGLIKGEELREILILGDDELRENVIDTLAHWTKPADAKWRQCILIFLDEVWPKQRAVRVPRISARLADLAFESGDLMPAVTRLVLPRLVPIRRDSLRSFWRTVDDEAHPAQLYPAETLDLLWAVLPEDRREWPYRTDDALDVLSKNPVTAADARLSELRRRRRQN